MTFGSPTGSPQPERCLHLVAGDEYLQEALHTAREQQRRETPDFEHERDAASRPVQSRGVALWHMFSGTEELQQLRHKNPSDTYHFLLTLHYCSKWYSQLEVSAMDVQDATICSEMGTVARHMLERATTRPEQRRRQKKNNTSWTRTWTSALEYCRVLYSKLKAAGPSQLEQIRGSEDASVWKAAIPVVYDMLQRAGIPEQLLLDSSKEIEWPSFWADEVIHLEPLAEAAERAHRLSLAVRPSPSSQSPRPEETQVAPPAPRPAPQPPRRNRTGGRVQKRRKNSEAVGVLRRQRSRVEKSAPQRNGTSKRTRILNGLENSARLDDKDGKACMRGSYALRWNAAREMADIQKRAAEHMPGPLLAR